MLLTTVLQTAAASIPYAKIIAPIGAALTVFAAAYGISVIGKAAMEAIARQPESADSIRMSMIVVAALIEGATLFAIIVCLLVAL